MPGLARVHDREPSVDQRGVALDLDPGVVWAAVIERCGDPVERGEVGLHPGSNDAPADAAHRA
ncbi:MAG: hypothetical protein ACRDMA_13310 [Solirubrobacterales bacterium]